MNRSIAIATGTLAVCIIGFAVVYHPIMVSQMRRNVMVEQTGTPLQKTDISSQSPETVAETQKYVPPKVTEEKPTDNMMTAEIKHPATPEESTIKEIKDTSKKPSEDQQKAPIAMSNIGETGNDGSTQDEQPGFQPTVAVTVVNPAPDGMRVSIRGTENDNATQNAQTASEPTVAINTDGAYNSQDNSGQNLYDVERVEVLYGPPSAMYGSNATGGGASSSQAKPNEFTLEEITVEPQLRAGKGASQNRAMAAAEKSRLAAEAAAAKAKAFENMSAPPQYVGGDKFEEVKPNTVKSVTEEPVSTFSVDVDTASYAYVRNALNSGAMPRPDSIRIEEMINYFDYDYPLPDNKSVPFKPTVAIFPTPWNPDTKLLHIGIKGYDIVTKKRPSANLVFLIDVSGSMDEEDKLPLLKNSLRMFVKTLKADDSVAIVTYSSSAETVLKQTKGSDRATILAAIDRLQAGGSTAGAEGIQMAYSVAEANITPEAVNRVILATDGDFNVGMTDTNDLQDLIVRKRKSGIYLSILGFGQGNYRDELMQTLAQNGNGNAAYIDNLNEAYKVLVDEAGGIIFTIAKDVKIQVEFNPSMVSEYRLIGYETRQLNQEDFKNDSVDAGEIGSGHAVTAIYEITPKGSPAQLIDDLRYNSKKEPEGAKNENSEYAFLKIRYKLPDEDSSREISTPIDKGNEYKKIASTPADSRFATAVAAFGQLLRGDSYIKNFTYDNVIKLAKDAMKDDNFGYRNEFLSLVRLAKAISTSGTDNGR